jgi:hypothetical protein
LAVAAVAVGTELEGCILVGQMQREEDQLVEEYNSVAARVY